MTKTLLALAITLGLVGGTSAQTSNPPKMGVDLVFDPKHKCQGISPEIRLSNVPPGVASYGQADRPRRTDLPSLEPTTPRRGPRHPRTRRVGLLRAVPAVRHAPLRDHRRGARRPEPGGRFRRENRRHGQIVSPPLPRGTSLPSLRPGERTRWLSIGGWTHVEVPLGGGS